jgi:hypothetical protein
MDQYNSREERAQKLTVGLRIKNGLRVHAFSPFNKYYFLIKPDIETKLKFRDSPQKSKIKFPNHYYEKNRAK